jgi:dihydroorotase
MRFVLSNINSAFGIPFLKGVSNFDLLVEDGIVKKYGKGLNSECDDFADCSGLTLCPGWIDMHTHVYKDICDIALDPDLLGPKRGVTAVVDAGSSGCLTFQTFRNTIIEKRKYPVYAFLNYGSLGIIRCNVIGDYETDDFIQEDETLACIQKNRDVIKGVKVRACSVVLKNRRDVEIVAKAKALAERANLPVMVHIGEPKPELADILQVLTAGDIVTHCFHGKRNGKILGISNRILDPVLDAKRRGVLFDVGHGCASFDFAVGQAAAKQDFFPDLFGTDLHKLCYPFPVESLAVTLSKMLSCGVPFDQVLYGATIQAANVLNIEAYQKSFLGKKARFTLFTVEDRQKTYHDSMGNSLDVQRQFVPHLAIVGEEIFPCR